jgi:hypothetical protein
VTARLRSLRRLLFAGSIVLATAAIAAGQSADTAPGDSQSAAQPLTTDARRACDGCPVRSVGRSIWQATGVNILYELGNLARGQVTARITPQTWWTNMKTGWVWDLDDFTVNQIGHPYQGSNYFNAARANGLSFYESAAVTAFGSATWEYFGETNHASLNDFVNTTLGGIALGEMFHRTAWLIRDTHATGRSRLWQEIGATVVDPVTGANRFLTGDASRVSDKPRDMVPASLGGFTSAGVLWRGSQTNAFKATGQPFLETNLFYGNVERGRSRTPYETFAVRLRFGGGSAFSEAYVRGRLLGQPLHRGGLQFNVRQTYDYQSNDAYATGSQSFEAVLGARWSMSTRTNLTVMGWGGLTVLGAVDSLPLGVTEKPPEQVSPSAGQGVSEGPRYYDYGPGSDFGAFGHLDRNGRSVFVVDYDAHQLYSLDGVRANHLLQRVRADFLLPVHGRFGIGTSLEYFFRKSYYQDPQRTRQAYRYPQIRTYLTWSQQ